jgi:hypothetical protein
MLTDDIVALRALKTFEDQAGNAGIGLLHITEMACSARDGALWRVGLSDQSARYLIEKQ